MTLLNKLRKPDFWKASTLVVLVLYGLFFIYPIVNLLAQSIYDPSLGGFTLTHFNKFFSQPYYLKTIVNSFQVTIIATLLTLLIGIPLAYFTTVYKVRGKKFLNIIIILCSMSAPFIGAYSWILLLGRSGLITKFMLSTFGIVIPDIYGFSGILLVLTLQLFPLVYLYIQGALSSVDNSLFEASESMGITGFKRFFKVVLPLIKPTIYASALLVFMRAFADFGTPMLIGEGYRTFPRLIFDEFISEMGGDTGFAAAISVIAILLTTVFFLFQRWLSNRNQFSMSALHSIEPKPMKRSLSVMVHTFVYGVVAVAFMPQVYVFYTSFLKTSGLIFVDGYSLDSYREAFSRLGNSIQNTFIIPGIALVIIVIMAVIIAYIAVRRRNPLTATVDAVSMIPYIIPGTVLGIAMLTSLSKRPFMLTGTFTIMIIALVVRRLPYTIRSSVAILQQISISVEEAAISLGTSNSKTFFKITVPMMSAGVISGAILSWITMISELSTAIILYTSKTQTMTVSIYTQVIRGNYGIAAALSAILTGLTIISLLVFMKLSKGKNIQI
ncbi:iron ABC transporter permease [Erysipelothrix sp. HDW6B]|uniref:ABC transporter permease n=1 Tax=Erysipelothrix TaxID=1647 RepID=UPI001359FFF5|nr:MULTISPECIES: iron ABC transporter permease [Erysipelothrix]QIK86294.1 iron ABC transporter permease [Erysipelothrix sp. HDW6B]